LVAGHTKVFIWKKTQYIFNLEIYFQNLKNELIFYYMTWPTNIMGGRESLSSGKNRIVTLTFFGSINLGQWMHDTVTRPNFTDTIQKRWGCQPKENLKFIIWPTKVSVSFIVSAFFTLPNLLPKKYFFIEFHVGQG